jgi:hypothetical protein
MNLMKKMLMNHPLDWKVYALANSNSMQYAVELSELCSICLM